MLDSYNKDSTWGQAYEDYKSRMAEQLLAMSSRKEGEQVSPSPTSPRESLLNDARRIVTGERNVAYGEPEDNSRRIGDLWNVFLQGRTKPPTEPLDPYEVFLMMALMKIARLMHDPSNYDSYLDAVGYITVAWDAYTSAQEGNST